MPEAKILIVEDEGIIAADLEDRIKHLGFQVCDTVVSGEKAIEANAREKPDLILMDIYLKGEMNGVEAAARINLDCHVPIVFLAAYGDDEQLRRAARTQPFGYLLKPVNNRDLEVTIKMALLASKQRKEKLEAQKETRETERLIRALLNNTSDLVMTHDLRGTLLTVNTAVPKLFGYSAPEMIGRPISDFIQPEYRPDFGDQYMNQILSDGFAAGIMHAQGKAGDRFSLEYRNVLMRPETGEPFVSGMGRDVTRELKANEDLRAAKEYSDQILRIVPSAVFTVDLDRRITSWNEYAARLTGYSAREMIGKHCLSFALSPCADRCNLPNTEIPKPINEVECTIRDKDGRIRNLKKNVDVIRDGLGRVIGGIESFQDITERLIADRKIAEAHGRYQSLFTDSPISLWVENFSEVKKYLEDLRLGGVMDLKAFFEVNPSSLEHIAKIVKVLEVNEATLKLYRADTQDEFIGHSRQIPRPAGHGKNFRRKSSPWPPDAPPSRPK